MKLSEFNMIHRDGEETIFHNTLRKRSAENGHVGRDGGAHRGPRALTARMLQHDAN